MANNILAKMAVQISANTAEFNKRMAESAKSLGKVADETKKTNSILSIFGKTIGAAGLAISVGALAKSVFDLGVKQEQTTIAFNTFLGSASRGKQLLQELNEFSIVTPFSPDQVNNAAKALLSFGVEANKVLPTLKFLGDVSSGTGKDLTELAIIFGQIRSTGRLMGQDLLQLINAGFNPLQIISKETGKSVGELKKEMEKGLISFDMVENAFKKATSEGGLFFNLMEKQSQTIGGRISTLAGNFQELGKNIFSLSSGPIPAAISAFDELLVAVNKFLNPGEITSLKRFTDKLKEIDTQLQSDNEQIRQYAVGLQNLFAQDVVSAINEANAELSVAEGSLEALKSAGITSGDAFKKATAEVKALKAEIEGLQNIKTDVFNLRPKTPTTPNKVITNAPGVASGIIGFDPKALADAVEQQLNRINGIILDVNGNVADLSVTFEEIESEIPDSLQKTADKMVEISGLIVGGIVDIADAFGQAAVTGAKDFGRTFLRSLGRFAQQFGALLIATGLGERALQFGGPGAKIAAGAALVAIGGAISALMANKPSLSGGGSGGRGTPSFSPGFTGVGNLEFSADFRISGYNLEAVLDKQTYKKNRIGG